MKKLGKLVGVCNGQVHCDLGECIADHDLTCEHKPFIEPGELKSRGKYRKRRKYASYQNHLNRKKVIII